MQSDGFDVMTTKKSYQMENGVCYEISTESDRIDSNFVHNYLSNESYWAKGISLEKVKRSIQHSLCFGVFLMVLDDDDDVNSNNSSSNNNKEKDHQEKFETKGMKNASVLQQQQQQQVGFGRVISDYATYAYVSDVFIDPDHRGQGLSKRLVENMMEHPELQGLRSWTLMTLDAHGLYERFGFTAPGQVPRYMVHRPEQQHQKEDKDDG